MADASRSISARLTRFLTGLFGGERNDVSDSGRHHELDPLIADLQRLTDDDIVRLADLWQHEDADARHEAWTNAQAALNESGGKRALERVRQVVAGWINARQSDFRGVEGLLGRAGTFASAREAAAPAVIDKAVAMLGRDVLDDDDYLVLARPWDTLLGRETPTRGADTPEGDA